MTKTDSFEFYFFITCLLKNKKWEKYVSKSRIFRLVDYKKSFRSSVTRGKSKEYPRKNHNQRIQATNDTKRKSKQTKTVNR